MSNSFKYIGSRVAVIVDNSKLPIANIGVLIFPLENNKNKITLTFMYHVTYMKKNLLSIW